MKRCLQCGREYDTSMMFCLDDGAELLYGPASMDEPATAILSDPGALSGGQFAGENTTSPFIHTTAAEAEPPGNLDDSTQRQSLSAHRTAKPLAAGAIALFVLVGGFLGYRYLNPTRGDQINSIAVMPFVNESGNADVEYLSDGMTETLIRSLSQLANLQVRPRSSVFRYKGKETDAKTVGEELNVQAILNGRVAQRGDQLTLNLELIDVQRDVVLWSEQYNRKQTDLVSLQSEIAKDVSTKLKLKLSGTDEAKVTKTATANPEAYQAYLKGRYYWNRRTAENIYKATQQFKAASDADPNYALAYAGLADCYALLPEYAGTPTSETAPQARAFAERAIAIDSQLAEPHATLGIINHKSWQWAESEQEYKRAIEINPNYATSFHWYSILLKDLGRNREAAAMIKRAYELDPVSGAIGCNISMIHQLQNDHRASVENSLRMIELDPNFGRAYEYLGLSYLKLGRQEDAVKTMERAVELTNRQNVVLSELGYVYGAVGKRAEALAVAKELEEKYARRKAAGHEVAAVYSGMGDKDKAFEWLEKDFRARDGRLTTFRWETQFEPLRDDPRFKDLVIRMNLPE
jgi:adenylate cyclase